MSRIVEIVPYDPNWPDKYNAEMVLIAGALGSNLAAAHHIGSTAVPGLAAKPTIDILLVVDSLDALDASNEKMSDLGYQAKGEHGIPGRRYFQKLDGDVHLFHIHAFNPGHPDVDNHLNFRDYLIAHPKTAQAYQHLKRDLAKRYRHQPAAYTAGKDTFIWEVNQQAAAWRSVQSEEPSKRQ